MSDCGCSNPEVNFTQYVPGEVRLYGRHPTGEPSENQDLVGLISDLLDIGSTKFRSVGIIYGYAHEGHCYKLPKPQIMLLTDVPKNITDGDCGYRGDLGYSVWKIDKLERAVVLDVRTDDIKTLVLDANTPGNRSPLAYAQEMALAPHRSSRD
jgi:hypothetical protein